MLRTLMPDLLAHTGSVGFAVSAISAVSSEERRQGHKRRERGAWTRYKPGLAMFGLRAVMPRPLACLQSSGPNI